MKIDVKSFIEKRREVLINKTKSLHSTPFLTTILVGSRPDSATYVRRKGEEISISNMESETCLIEDGTPFSEIYELIEQKGKDPKVNGILLQLPLNREFYSKQEEDALIAAIPSEKDVDGLTMMNQAKLFMGHDRNTFLTPCTPTGIVELLKDMFDYSGLRGRDILVVGRSQLLGNSLAQMLMREDANVTILHSKSECSVRSHIENNWVGTVCLCAGQPDLLNGDIDADYLHTIIDAGINVGEDGKLRGDFKKEDYADLDELDIDYTTVPGGVGPITTHMLACNLYKAFCLQNDIKYTSI